MAEPLTPEEKAASEAWGKLRGMETARAAVSPVVREALVAWERYVKAETDEARAAYWPALGRAMDDLNDAWWSMLSTPAAALAAEEERHG